MRLKIFILMFVFVLLIGSVSAFTFSEIDNYKSYDEKTKTITIKNGFTLGTTIAEVELKTPLNYKVPRGYQKVAEFEVRSNGDYKNAFKELELFDIKKNLKKINRDIDYKYLTYETILVDDYKNIVIGYSNNGSAIYEYKIVGNHEEQREKWIKLTPADFKKNDVITIGIFTDVQKGDKIEWIPNLFGVRIDEWAVWTEDLNVGLIAYYKLNETSGVVVDSLGINNGSNSGSTRGVAGLINNSFDFDGTNDRVTISSPTGFNWGTGDFTINFWMNSSTAKNAGIIGAIGGWNSADEWSINNRGTDQIQFNRQGGGGTVFTETGLNDGTWKMVTLVREGTGAGQFKFYVNGSLSQSVQLPGTINTPDNVLYLAFGEGGVGGAGNYYEGRMDEVDFYNRSLNQSEITQKYNNHLGITFTDVFSPSVTLNIPTNNTVQGTNNLTFNCSSESSVGKSILNISLIIDGILNTTVFNTTSNQLNISLQTDLNLSEGSHNWTCNSFDNEQLEGTTETRIFTIDSTAPIINITSPLGIINYHLFGSNLSLNWTVSDIHLDSCWFEYDFTNTSLTCGNNNYSFITTNQKNLTFYANDTSGNLASNFTSWNYQVFETNRIFNSPVIEGSEETFELFINTLTTITEAEFIYNSTSYVPNVLSLGGEAYKISSTIITPQVVGSTNITFYFNISLSGGDTIQIPSSEQEVVPLNLGNCTAYSNLLINISLFDERTIDNINGTIEFDFDILNEVDLSFISEIHTVEENVHTTSICSDVNITEGNFIYNLEIRYFSPGNGTTFSHVPEFYHIQQASVSNLPQNIQLFDLNINESTEFTIFYRDNNYLTRENVLFQIQRKYVSEGIFRTIEIPITSSEGSAVGHFDLNNYKYKITVTLDGEVLNVFDNPAIRCESELSGICNIDLKGSAPTPSVDFTSNLVNFFYTLDQTNDSVVVDFSIPTGESEIVNILMIQTSPFTDPLTICNQTILSSAGSIECGVNATIGDSSVNVNIVSNGDTKGNLLVTFQEDLNTSFLLNNYFIASVLLMFLILIFATSPQLMVVSSVFGVAYLGLVFLLKSNSIGLALGAISWLIIAGAIILSKLNKKEEQ